VHSTNLDFVQESRNAPIRIVGELVPISSTILVRGGVHPGQVASPSQGNTQDKQHDCPKANLEGPINLTVMFLDCWRKLENPERTHACTGRTWRKTPSRESNQGPFCCKATVLPTMPPCSP
ncbi:hypothetical protein ILYODFUR_007339, partial [Ilyodon furcidens]